MNYEIKTFTGKFINLLDPLPDEIDIEDIAIGLSREGRWGNQSRRVISVAEHSCIVSYHCFDAFSALMHDATEAYIRDLQTQAKALVPEYKVLEKRLYRAIALHFNIPFEIPGEVKTVENFLIKKEYAYLCYKPSEMGYQDHSEIFNCWPAHIAYNKFMERFTELKEAHVLTNRELSL